MREKVSGVEPSAEKISARVDSDATILFDPSKLGMVHAAETPENSDLPAATEVEDHLVSLSYSILETSVESKSPILQHHNPTNLSFGLLTSSLSIKWTSFNLQLKF